MIFGRDADVFTFSIHQQHNYPMWKPPSDLDIGLPDGTRDETYLGKLDGALTRSWHRAGRRRLSGGRGPVQVEDQLGGLSLTKEGFAGAIGWSLKPASRGVPSS